ncbi:hypothetical protein O181_065618 [Austropuccinia psidii MF-1]|uniref:Uncharacterized protein n=1 Tax=Austropuccinia psidii MF-1 TaxID=1389203 RepID=A0A9Q3EPY8_9BASI|nr:hypothetical protein [Austropuccinia psidii MF-1]
MRCATPLPLRAWDCQSVPVLAQWHIYQPIIHHRSAAYILSTIPSQIHPSSNSIPAYHQLSHEPFSRELRSTLTTWPRTKHKTSPSPAVLSQWHTVAKHSFSKPVLRPRKIKDSPTRLPSGQRDRAQFLGH